MTKEDELKIIGKALDVAHGGKFEALFHYFGVSGLQVTVRMLSPEADGLGDKLADFDFNTRKPLDAQHYRKYEQIMNSFLPGFPS